MVLLILLCGKPQNSQVKSCITFLTLSHSFISLSVASTHNTNFRHIFGTTVEQCSHCSFKTAVRLGPVSVAQHVAKIVHYMHRIHNSFASRKKISLTLAAVQFTNYSSPLHSVRIAQEKCPINIQPLLRFFRITVRLECDVTCIAGDITFSLRLHKLRMTRKNAHCVCSPHNCSFRSQKG